MVTLQNRSRATNNIERTQETSEKRRNGSVTSTSPNNGLVRTPNAKGVIAIVAKPLTPTSAARSNSTASAAVATAAAVVNPYYIGGGSNIKTTQLLRTPSTPQHNQLQPRSLSPYNSNSSTQRGGGQPLAVVNGGGTTSGFDI